MLHIIIDKLGIFDKYKHLVGSFKNDLAKIELLIASYTLTCQKISCTSTALEKY